MKGFYGRLLRVNLKTKSCTVEAIPDEVFKKYLGGKGLGSYLLLENVAPGIDPLSSENKLIFTNGLTTGTNLFGSCRYGVFTKSPATGLYSESYSGGKVAPQISASGYDAIILEEASEIPVYLEISDEKVKFHDAGHLWGKTTYETEDALIAEINVPKAQAVVIGPAGENMARYACIENNYWRSAGRTGVGAVMGSKKVKGIVFYGSSKVEVAHPDLLLELNKEIAAQKDHPGIAGYKRFGTTGGVAGMNAAKAFPTRYWGEASFDKWENICAEKLHSEYDVKGVACLRCFIACGRKTTVLDGKYKGLTIEGPEYETLYVFGGLCCIDKLDEIIYLNDICDRLGMDTMTAGNLVGLVMEATAQGRKIPVSLEYGDAEGAAKLLEDMAYLRGAGAVLGKGIKEVAKEWGLEDVVVHCKGLEPAGYDPRRLKGMSLAYATSTRGACHLRSYIYKLELGGMIDRKVVEGKAEAFVEAENRLCILNTGTLCVFFRDLYQWPALVKLVKGVTGLDYSEDDLRNIANGIITLTRTFNAREGATKKDDTLPPRIFNVKVNDGEDSITPEELEYMVNEYYLLRGWDDAGFPAAI